MDACVGACMWVYLVIFIKMELFHHVIQLNFLIGFHFVFKYELNLKKFILKENLW